MENSEEGETFEAVHQGLTDLSTIAPYLCTNLTVKKSLFNNF